MDGNGRWASKNNVSKKIGHKTGIQNCISICKNLNKLKFRINELSFYVFSTENWYRKPSEINNLFNLIEVFYEEFQNTANESNLRIRHYGSRKKLSKKILQIIDSVTKKTKNNNGCFINLLFNYGSRQEIIDAVEKIRNSDISSKKLDSYFYVPKSTDPDLIIRTGGEKRLSNFMLWQGAYSELYFTNILWPDFKITNLDYAIKNYFTRTRNLGR
tara:strand:+ start:1361 stop:2005 length:645 start_codon:yes stop_codon:yes gene_type:complete